jgi:hypothetical protein
MHALRAAAFTLTLMLPLSGCVFLPRTTLVYDPDCHITTRQMRLEPVEIGQLQRCGQAECGAILVAVGAVAAASLVISGSIVIVGNVVEWAEKQGRCQRGEPQPP